VIAARVLPIMSEDSGGAMRRRLSLMLAALAVVALTAAVIAFFVPVKFALALTALAIILVAVGAFTLARQL
jgi:uncharacterized membrane protein